MSRNSRKARIWWTVGLLTAVALLGAATPVVGQETESPARRVEQVLPAEAAARVMEIARAAEERGVPPVLVYRKALEGAAKGVPPRRIVTALEGYARRLGTARQLVGPGRNPQTVAAAAEALRRGVPADVVRNMARQQAGRRDLAVPLLVLGELTAAGVPTSHALDMVRMALARGAPPDRLLAMSAAIRRRIRAGDDWRSAVDAVRRRMLERRAAPDRVRPQEDGRVRRPGAHRRPLTESPVPPGTNPPLQSGDRMRMGDGP